MSLSDDFCEVQSYSSVRSGVDCDMAEASEESGLRIRCAVSEFTEFFSL